MAWRGVAGVGVALRHTGGTSLYTPVSAEAGLAAAAPPPVSPLMYEHSYVMIKKRRK